MCGGGGEGTAADRTCTSDTRYGDRGGGRSGRHQHSHRPTETLIPASSDTQRVSSSSNRPLRTRAPSSRPP